MPIHFRKYTFLLALLALGHLSARADASPAEQTETTIREIVTLIESHKTTAGSYPDQKVGLDSLPNLPRDRQLDGWERALVYNFPSTRDEQTFDLFSAGADGVSTSGGTDPDDINHWDPKTPWRHFYESASTSDYWRYGLGAAVFICAAILAWQRAKRQQQEPEVIP